MTNRNRYLTGKPLTHLPTIIERSDGNKINLATPELADALLIGGIIHRIRIWISESKALLQTDSAPENSSPVTGQSLQEKLAWSLDSDLKSMGKTVEHRLPTDIVRESIYANNNLFSPESIHQEIRDHALATVGGLGLIYISVVQQMQVENSNQAGIYLLAELLATILTVGYVALAIQSTGKLKTARDLRAELSGILSNEVLTREYEEFFLLYDRLTSMITDYNYALHDEQVSEQEKDNQLMYINATIQELGHMTGRFQTQPVSNLKLAKSTGK